MLSHAFSVSSSILCMLFSCDWFLFWISKWKISWFCGSCAFEKLGGSLILNEIFTVCIFIYFNHLSITGLLQHAMFRGRPSWTSSLFLRCKSIPLFVWSGYECCEKTGLLGVCFLNSMLLFVREFSDFIWGLLAPLSQLIKDGLRLWSLPCPLLCVSLITDWQLLSLRH